MIKKYYLKNKIKIRNKQKIYNARHKNRIKFLKRKWYLRNKIQLKEKRKINRKIHKEQIAKQVKDYQEKHKKEITLYKKLWHQKNKKNINLQIIKRLKTDINFRLAHYLRNRMRKVLKGLIKSKSTIKLLGCSLKTFRKHLENKFTKGMSLDNYGKWHIDHIRPCASFDLSKASEQRKCFNYKNLQPLWAKDNLIKSDNF